MNVFQMAIGIPVWMIASLIILKVKGFSGVALGWIVGVGLAALVGYVVPLLHVLPQVTMQLALTTGFAGVIGATITSLLFKPKL
jgi:hypothetical protein